MLAIALALAVARPVAAVAAPAELTDADRVAYWLDRIVRGPEPARLALPHFHQALLSEAQRNLEALADVTLDRLADPRLRHRVQSLPDMNPWHGVLTVLGRIGSRRPEVARAWAAPALIHPQRTMRRSALGVVIALGSPSDGPALVDVLRRDADDRILGPAAVAALVALGPPWDGAAARTVLEQSRDDGAGVGSTAWAALVGALGASKAPSRDAVLAWTALVAEAGGPRAATPHTRNPALGADDPTEAVPSDAARTSGRLIAAVARATLSRQGAAPWRAAVERDLADPTDADVRTIAADGIPRTPAAKAATHAAAVVLAARLRRGDPTVTPDAVVEATTWLRADRAPGAAERLVDLFTALPADPRFTEGLRRAFDGARALGVEPVDAVTAHLASGDRARVDLALRLVRTAADGPYLDVVEAWLATAPGGGDEREGRRAVLYLYAVAFAEGRLPADRVDRFATTLRGWGEDPADPSAAGLLGGLLELGPAGERELVAGLGGADRSAYVALLASDAARPLSAAVVAALLASLSPTMPPGARAELWNALFRTASPDGVPAIEAALAGLPASQRAEGEAIVRIARHRVPRP